jgi:hypothetical protein
MKLLDKIYDLAILGILHFVNYICKVVHTISIKMNFKNVMREKIQ